MDFRHISLWQGIDAVQPHSATPENKESSAESRGSLCSLPQFRDRLDIAMRRSARMHKYAVFILLEFAQEHLRLGGDGEEEQEGGLLIYRLRSCIRSSDSLCRLGEGRFALLLEDVKEPTAVPLMIEKIESTLVGPLHAQADDRQTLRPNVAASLLLGKARSVARVWLETEAALEMAVIDGPGRYRILPRELGREALLRFDLGRDMHRAYRNKEFDLSYQPVVGLSERRPRAIEGLLRWQHPQRGCLYPGVFLPMLEESGLIVPIGEQLLLQACRSGRRLIGGGLGPVRLGVNISFRQLTDPGFMLCVLDALYDSGLAAESLQLEFSESVLTRDLHLVRPLLAELDQIGIALAVDQFGSAGMPLSVLAELPLSAIKFSPAVVRRLPSDPVAHALVSGAIAFARATGKRVTAVGVEQSAEECLLAELGCDEAQGGYYFPPQSGASLMRSLTG